MSEHFTVFGGSGFLGSEIAAQLEGQGHSVLRVTRTSWPAPGTPLGHVIFTIGMTADFRNRLLETFDLHILKLHAALTGYAFDSFVYLSSARVYSAATSTQEEAPLIVRPAELDHVYNISKLAGESLCLAYQNPRIRVVRLSNVYGARDVSNLFMTAVLREAVAKGSVMIGQAPESSKDYILVEDAAASVILIARSGKERLYNVAYGRNITHREIADLLIEENYSVDFGGNGMLSVFPKIDTRRLDAEFEVKREQPAAGIKGVLHSLRQQKENK